MFYVFLSKITARTSRETEMESRRDINSKRLEVDSPKRRRNKKETEDRVLVRGT